MQIQRRLCPGLASIWALALAFGMALLPVHRCAAETLVNLTSQTAGQTPFINWVQGHMQDTNLLAYVQFTITPKTESVTRPLSARYSNAYLTRRGFLHFGTGIVTVPIFGLYDGYTNTVDIVFGFVDGTSQSETLSIATAPFAGGVYSHPKVVQARTVDTTLSYDFILLKAFSSGYSPIVIDTDGAVRWVGTANNPSMETIFYDNSFFVVNGTTLQRMEFDGAVTDVANYASSGVTGFTHNFDFGKTGFIMDVNTSAYFDSTNVEVDTTGKVLHTWNLAAIITNAMIAGGDDPSKFVSVYRPSDDSLVVSSRENFVIALDYKSKAIKWILGDPTKQWHQFPSLRKYALKTTGAAPYPVGQHAVSFYDDELLLFDCGYYSADHSPKGVNRTYSAPRKYVIDQTARTATEVWDYVAGQSMYSPLASSVYEDGTDDYLIDYATEGPYLDAEIIGLAPSGSKVFDYQFTEIGGLDTAWNATVMHLENLVFN
jgi:arylsulfate sulfotransferase